MWRRFFSSSRVLRSDKPPLTDRQKRLYPQTEQTFTDEGFPVLDLKPSKPYLNINPREKRRPRQLFRNKREHSMSTDQDWSSVWPTPKVFSPDSVPLQLRQSYERKHIHPERVSLPKYANTELIKICNFLHLTPPAIKKHCEAIKKFCSDWPEGLETESKIRQHFPVTYVERSYVQCGPTIRNELARIVDLVINLDDLKLTGEDLEKFKLLARDRYDSETNLVTISVKACPSRVQNKDYADYILRALYFESRNHEDWESEKPDKRVSFATVEELDEYKAKVESNLRLKEAQTLN